MSDQATSDWKEMKDKSGKTYYYNTKTKKTTWTIPSNKDDNSNSNNNVNTTPTAVTASQASDWKEMKDKSGKTYYYNTKTKKTVWNLEKELASSSSSPSSPSMTHTADTIKSKWKELKDKKGRTYYYNTETKQTTWDRPQEEFDDKLLTTESTGEEEKVRKEEEQEVLVDNVTADRMALVELKKEQAAATSREALYTEKLSILQSEVTRFHSENKTLKDMMRSYEEELHRLKFALFHDKIDDNENTTFSTEVKASPMTSGSDEVTRLRLRMENILVLNQRLQLALSDERKKRNLCAGCTGFLHGGATTTVAKAMSDQTLSTDPHQPLIPRPTTLSDDAWYHSIVNGGNTSGGAGGVDVGVGSYTPKSCPVQGSCGLLTSQEDKALPRPMYIPRTYEIFNDSITGSGPPLSSSWRLPTAQYRSPFLR
eukprot:PhM_4_TR12310/c0_g1_i1/m.1640